MRILCLIQNFRQGWGGGPESIRLMARQLSSLGISFDVVDRGQIHRAIEGLDFLPAPEAKAEPFDLGTVGIYQAILQVGPWQEPVAVSRLLARRRPGQKLLYLPRGGLAQIEFVGRQALKKLPYFYLIERFFVSRSDGVIFSSSLEEARSPLARNLAPHHIIPDFFEAGDLAKRPHGQKSPKTTFSMLAEISPRKGLLPFLEAYVRWNSEQGLKDRTRLVIGGAPRRGQDDYFAAAMRVLRSHDLDVCFMGAIPHADRAKFYSDSDVIVVPSLFESFGLTALEGLTAGCTLLGSSELGVAEFLPAHRQRVLAGSLKMEALADALTLAFDAVAACDKNDEVRHYAKAVTGSINEAARARWSDLLFGGSGV